MALGLFTRWFHRGGLIAGWVSGMGVGVWTLYTVRRVDPATGDVIREHFTGSAFSLSNLGFDTRYTIYAGLLALVANLIVAAAVTWALRMAQVPDGVDATSPADYTAERFRRPGA